jgi:ABC-type phosphate transport system substrate-binding protein
MRNLSARGIMPACIAAVAALGLAVPGTALAKNNPNQCSGVNIEGKGSSFQKSIEVNFWTPQFNTLATAKTACSGTQGDLKKPTVKYTSTGSGAALKSWGIENEGSEISFAATNAFISTDDPVNPSQTKEVEKQESTETPGSVLTFPVSQGAITVIMHLPTGCTATSTASPERLVIGQSELQGVFAGTVKTWGQLKAGGDKLTGAGCEEAKIQPAVRKDESGSTHILMKFLNLINKEPLATAKGSHTWAELAEGALNQTWPTAAGVVTPAGTGGGELAALVAANPGDIGYVDLATARSKTAFGTEGGAGKPTFWAEVENENKKGKAKFAEPSINGENGTTSTANCKKTLYANFSEGKEIAFPPPSVTENWNEVTTKVAEKTYPLCGLTYNMAFTKYSLLPGTSASEVQTVEDYTKFVMDKKGGQKLAAEGDYAALPKAVLSISAAGLPLIGD